jgi:hypothetical protein
MVCISDCAPCGDGGVVGWLRRGFANAPSLSDADLSDLQKRRHDLQKSVLIYKRELGVGKTAWTFGDRVRRQLYLTDQAVKSLFCYIRNRKTQAYLKVTFQLARSAS